jgi:hypothetical protein
MLSVNDIYKISCSQLTLLMKNTGLFLQMCCLAKLRSCNSTVKLEIKLHKRLYRYNLFAALTLRYRCA